MLLHAAAAPALAQAPDVFTFESWYAACDNLRRCAVFSPPAEDQRDAVMFIRLSRGAGAADRPALRLVREDQQTPPGPWVLLVDGQEVARLPAPATSPDGFRRAELPPAAADALRDGARAEIRAGDQPLGTIPLRGSAAVFRWVDDRQGRAGTTAALAARGPATPRDAAVPRPVIRSAPLPPQSNLPRKPSAALLAAPALRDCDDARSTAPQVFRLAPDSLFWAVTCNRAAYNTEYRLLLTDERGGTVRLAPVQRLTEPPFPGSMIGASFDPATATLTNFSKGRGLADCGEAGRWVWDGTAFRLLRLVAMEDCRGIPPADWPVLYEARRP